VSTLVATGLQRDVAERVVGRLPEITRLAAGLAAGRDVLLEGPPGVSKSTLLRATAAAIGVPVWTVEGSALLTPARLVGAHDPSRVLQHGYQDADFTPGPLVEAMRAGGLLYIEEFNRVPDDTLNLLLGPLAERRLVVPRLGVIEAAPGFRMVAAMNPHSDAGAGRVSRSIADRLLRVSLTHQSEAEERAIVARLVPGASAREVAVSVAVTRATREHRLLARGSSVRGAVDLAGILPGLARLQGVADPIAPAGWDALVDAAQVALSGRIGLEPSASVTVEDVLTEIVLGVVGAGPAEIALAPRSRPGDARRGRGDAPVRPTAQPDLDRSLVWRKPGAADEDVVHQTAADATRAQPGRSRAGGTAAAGSVRSDQEVADDEPLALVTSDEAGGDGEARAHTADPAHLAQARRIARTMAIRMARRVPSASTGASRLRPHRYAFRSDDLDLDRTLEEIAVKPYPEHRDLWVTERVRAQRSYAVLLDISGSMKGEHLTTAAMAAAAITEAVGRDDVAIVAFWREAVVLKRLRQPLQLERTLADILSLRGMGLTNLHLGLRLGLQELQASTTSDRVALLLSDGGHNVGPDPLPLARRFTTLHVVGTSAEPTRVQACAELAAAGNGRCAIAADPDGIVAAVAHCLDA
jgi:MoxR-like ATPase